MIIGTDEVITIARSAEPGEHVPVHGPGGSVDGTVVGFDAASGLALLRVPGIGGKSLPAAKPPAVGELAVTVSCPIPLGHEARLSMIRCVGGETRLPGGRLIDAYYQTDDARHRGFSGSVLLSVTGSVLGIVMPTRRREESFVLPVDAVVRIADQLRSGRNIGIGYLGVNTAPVVLPVPSENAATGLLITGVEEGSPAKRAGLTVGQFITAVAGIPTPSVEALHDSLVGLTSGQTIDVSVAAQDGSVRTLAVPVVLR
ncbi:MAG: PDZ domain-containing protein [Spirochaetales bacterium]|nr:MAG: PDZ domain-containing protein [Spirochaetales bacterium]